MKALQNTFMRYELKYLVNAEQRAALTALFDRYMQPDEFGKSTICNLYYDTPDLRLARRSIERPVYKEKLRVRSYGPCIPEDRVFVELKRKCEGVVYKRRVSMTQARAEGYLANETAAPIVHQVVGELDYFRSAYPALAPKVYLAYKREAFFAKDDPMLRVTFDDDVLWRDSELSLCEGVYGSSLLQPGQSLLEIKLSSGMPLWLAHALSELRLFKGSFSKYGNAYKAMTGLSAEGSVHCA